MKALHCIVTIALLLVPTFPLAFDQRALPPYFQCPDEETGPVSVPDGTLVRLGVSKPGYLCILTFSGYKQNIEEPVKLPVARSYDGYNWESVAGPYSVHISCPEDKPALCFVEVPVENKLDGDFWLSSFTHGLGREEEISRFFEQTTFGPTMKTIQSFEETYESASLSSAFAKWTSEQMSTLEGTEHRRFFRQRVNTRYSTRESSMGIPGASPCSAGSRWRQYAFVLDDFDNTLDITKLPGNKKKTRYILSVNGFARTDVSSVEAEGVGRLKPGSYQICKKPWVEERVGGAVSVMIDGSCQRLRGGNPPVYFTRNSAKIEDIQFLRMGGESKFLFSHATKEELLLRDNITDSLCSDFRAKHFDDSSKPLFTRIGTRWYLYEPGLQLRENSLEQPVERSGASSSAKTFVNVDSCRLSTNENKRSKTRQLQETEALLALPNPDVTEPSLTLTEETLRQLFKLTGRFVYIMKGLRPKYSPCDPGSWSRWESVDVSQCNRKVLDDDTRDTLSILLRNSRGNNPHLRDVFMSFGHSQKFCRVNDPNRRITITVDSRCWKYIHSDNLNVYDMTFWAERYAHPGNADAEKSGAPNPIKKFAQSGEAVMPFPEDHPSARWSDSKRVFNLFYVGRFGDTVYVRDLPDVLRVPKVIRYFSRKDSEREKTKNVLVCGSPGEIANNPSVSDSFELTSTRSIGDQQHRFQRNIVWTMIALSSSDQLRQRAAWALSQLLAISPNDIAAVHQTENYLAYYDIFVRHAFGNYRDILKEVSYSPMMGEMLTYIDSKSSSYIFETLHMPNTFPDENYAREITQLFTAGLVKLHLNGTTERDENGLAVDVYDNRNIMDGARAWTGFTRQNIRENVENFRSFNRIDPMKIVAAWRDVFPKMILNNAVVGEGYPLCSDLPERSFLRKGAEYQLLGSSPIPQLQADSSSSLRNDSILRLKLDPFKSSLYHILCNERSDGNCDFKGRVVLEHNIPCYGLECEVDTLSVVQINNNFFEFVRRPCVHFPFFSGGKVIQAKGDTIHGATLCADPKTFSAGVPCCGDGAKNTCIYSGERVSYETATNRCEILPQVKSASTSCEKGSCGSGGFRWTNRSCKIMVKIDQDGLIAIVHDEVESSPHFLGSLTENWFRVVWTDGVFPNTGNQCSFGYCQSIANGQCLCRTEVVNRQVFHEAPKNSKDVLSLLRVGSVPPDVHDNGEYVLYENVNNVKVWVDRSRTYNDKTIFEMIQHGRVRYFKNVESMVEIASKRKSTTFKFHNPPHFVSFSEQEVRDAQHETDAVLDQYFYHDNTAPFLATRFIQRFGNSNPSPRYVESVAMAFRNGVYVWKGEKDEDDIEFGTKRYGDLKATWAAIILDREARSPVLDADPCSGSLREPLLKILHFMRAMEFKTRPDEPVPKMISVDEKIGQMAHAIPNVFSFFLPDYAPPGTISTASLVSPEAQVHTEPNVIGWLNGMFDMVKFGLRNCQDGFGPETEHDCKVGRYEGSSGQLTYKPKSREPNKIIEEMSMLLTAGRLNSDCRKIISNAYAGEKSEEERLLIAQQLILTTPEFHSTNLVRMTGKKRDDEVEEVKESHNKRYKAVVYVMLDGGADSYNYLVPHSKCKRKDMYDEYVEARGMMALDRHQLHEIDAKDQVCGKFGLHPEMPVLKELYEREEAIFLANTGLLFEPVTQDNWEEKTKTRLFAHDVQKRDVSQLDPFKMKDGTGYLGRMVDVLSEKGYRTASYSLSGTGDVLVGSSEAAGKIAYLSADGLRKFDPQPMSKDILPTLKRLNGKFNPSTSGVFAETWSAKVVEALRQSEHLDQTMGKVNLRTRFPGSKTGMKFEIVSRLIKSRGLRGTERDVFFVNLEGFDHHRDMPEKLNKQTSNINGALESFVKEMKDQRVWEDVVVVAVSDFGRTLTPNSSQGTDHAWGGNYFMVGGGLNGGQIRGKFPDDFFGPLNIGRGRLIPTTPWESPLNAVAEWFGVEDEDELMTVLPNRGNFKDALFRQKDLFRGKR